MIITTMIILIILIRDLALCCSPNNIAPTKHLVRASYQEQHWHNNKIWSSSSPSYWPQWLPQRTPPTKPSPSYPSPPLQSPRHKNSNLHCINCKENIVKRYFSFFLIRVILFRRRHCLLWPWRCPGPTVPMDNLYQSMPDNLYHILLIDSYRSARKHSLHRHHWFTTGDT